MEKYTKKVDISFDEAVKRIKGILAVIGFGVISEIDVKDTMKKKLDIEFDNYIILGACNPSSAFKALSEDKDIGLLLPCNIVIYSNKGSTHISTVLPTQLMKDISPGINDVAQRIEEKLKLAVSGV